MPSHSKRTSIPSKDRPSPIQDDLLLEEEEPQVDNTARLGKKRSKNATARQTARSPSRERIPKEIDLPPEEQDSPPPHVLQQIPRAFPSRPKDPPDLAEVGISEKVSDDHTPPQEPYLAPSTYGRSPPTDLLPGLAHAETPPTHPGYLERGGFSTRSPPISPPQVKARPVSFGGRPPSHYASSRASPAPYAYAPTAFGSPPNLPPHLPQQHFYNPQDVDLGLAPHSVTAQRPSPCLIKGSKLAISGRKEENAILLGYPGQLDVLSQHDQGLDHVGSLRHLPGTVIDAVFLSWVNGPDPYRDQRPLVALTLSFLDSHSDAPGGYSPNTYPGSTKQRYTIAVMVYSLKLQNLVCDLIRLLDQVPTDTPSQMPPTFTTSPRLEAHGNFLVVSLTPSGETFVFSPTVDKGGHAFECLTKVWTTLQPRYQRRDSSHGRLHDSDASPADTSRSQILHGQPIFSLNGRWLAYCPNAADVQSMDAALGESVVIHGGRALTSRSPGARPIVTCVVDSPDAPTLLGRMAKGAAQGILLGAELARERGMQLWRSYWNPDAGGSSSMGSQIQTVPGSRPTGNFPPTHAESNVTESNEPELVAIVDLKALQDREATKPTDTAMLTAVFQPLGGCSFLSLTPSGLGLLTASRKGDVQYVWDLFQMRHPRAAMLPQDHEAGLLTARVRQIAKYERMSPSVIVDLEWEAPLGSRFAVLTQNRTIHMFDLPAAALRWPPPRRTKNQRPSLASAEKTLEPASANSVASGFLASARAIASSTQPMLANLRGRTPSASGGVSGAGAPGLGLASATGLRSGKVVAAGFSKSLGAATDTVAQLRHAGQSRLHLTMNASPGRIAWRHKQEKPVLTLLDRNGVRNYFVRKTNPRERQSDTVSVFEDKKPIGNRYPADLGPIISLPHAALVAGTEGDPGFWKLSSENPRGPGGPRGLTAPLGEAEIETNAPYQPFHSDHRVSMSVYSGGQAIGESQFPTTSIIFQPQPDAHVDSESDKWVFGGGISTVQLNLGHAQKEIHDLQQSTMHRETMSIAAEGTDTEQIVSTTTRRRPKRQRHDDQTDGSAILGNEEEDFFEDEMNVLEFATDRV